MYCSYITGGGSSGGPQDNVLQFNPEDGSWSQVGQLQVARHSHGASVVNVDDVINYCK